METPSWSVTALIAVSSTRIENLTECFGDNRCTCAVFHTRKGILKKMEIWLHLCMQEKGLKIDVLHVGPRGSMWLPHVHRELSAILQEANTFPQEICSKYLLVACSSLMGLWSGLPVSKYSSNSPIDTGWWNYEWYIGQLWLNGRKEKMKLYLSRSV